MRSVLARARRRPVQALAWLMVLATAGYVLVGPFLAARYPLMTDLPFHAANASIVKHYWSPAWHFREQFVLQPFAVPYMTMYLIAAACMTFTGAVTSIKLAALVMLALLPLGLAVLFWGMEKSPLLGMAGLPFAWCGLAGWGFLSFLGAVGLFAMVVGVSLRVLARPSRTLTAWLCALLLAVFFTHPFRFPFAVCAVLASVVLMFPATRRVRPALVGLLPPLAVFGAWWLWRPPALSGGIELGLHVERLAEAPGLLFRSYYDQAEPLAARRYAGTLLAVAVMLASVSLLRRRSRLARLRSLGAHGVVLGCALVFLGLYLVLPMRIGLWWYVYPREITTAAFVALGLLPDLPRARLPAFAVVALLCAAALPFGALAVEHHRDFDRHTRDFDRVAARIPPAPKLLYLVFDHSGTRSVHAPFLHLPAYIQAERGGWLSFHFAVWGASPVVYRPDGVVPPKVPLRWEWTPERFRVLEHGRFFDWFLVRSARDPSWRLAADGSITAVAHDGRWWLYRRPHPITARWRATGTSSPASGRGASARRGP